MRAAIYRWTSLGLAAALSVHAVGGTAWASNAVAVPEIGPASISAGLAVLAGGLLVLRARRKR